MKHIINPEGFINMVVVTCAILTFININTNLI